MLMKCPYCENNLLNRRCNFCGLLFNFCSKKHPVPSWAIYCPQLSHGNPPVAKISDDFNLVELNLPPIEEDAEAEPVMLAGNLYFWNRNKGWLWIWNSYEWDKVVLGNKGEIGYYRIGLRAIISVFNPEERILSFYSVAALSGDYDSIKAIKTFNNAVSRLFEFNGRLCFFNQNGLAQLIFGQKLLEYENIQKRPLTNGIIKDVKVITDLRMRERIILEYETEKKVFTVSNKSNADLLPLSMPIKWQVLKMIDNEKYLVQTNDGQMGILNLRGNIEYIGCKYGSVSSNGKIFGIDENGQINMIIIGNNIKKINLKIGLDNVIFFIDKYLVGSFSGKIRVISPEGRIIFESQKRLFSLRFFYDKYGIALKGKGNEWFIL